MSRISSLPIQPSAPHVHPVGVSIPAPAGLTVEVDDHGLAGTANIWGTATQSGSITLFGHTIAIEVGDTAVEVANKIKDAKWADSEHVLPREDGGASYDFWIGE
jgi:hypothetical protein